MKIYYDNKSILENINTTTQLENIESNSIAKVQFFKSVNLELFVFLAQKLMSRNFNSKIKIEFMDIHKQDLEFSINILEKYPISNLHIEISCLTSSASTTCETISLFSNYILKRKNVKGFKLSSLYSERPDDNFLDTLIQLLNHPDCSLISVNYCNEKMISDDQVIKIFKSSRFEYLESLTLLNIGSINEETHALILQALKGKNRLEEIVIDPQAKYEFYDQLYNVVLSSPNIKVIGTPNIFLEDNWTVRVYQQLKSNKTLEKIDLGMVEFSAVGVDNLVEVLEENMMLQELKFELNDTGEQADTKEQRELLNFI